MNAEPAFREQIVLTIDDQSKVDLVMELLSHFDLVRARREQLPPALTITDEPESEPSTASAGGSDADLWALAGIWKDRDIDADQLRRQAWERRTQSYDL